MSTTSSSSMRNQMNDTITWICGLRNSPTISTTTASGMKYSAKVRRPST